MSKVESIKIPKQSQYNYNLLIPHKNCFALCTLIMHYYKLIFHT